MIRRFTSNKYFDLYLNAAQDNNIEFNYLVSKKPIGYFQKGEKKLYIIKNILGVNNVVSSLFANSKYVSYQILQESDFPIPKAILYKKSSSVKNLPTMLRKLKKPLVVKPKYGFGGHGVSVKLTNIKDIQAAIKSAQKVYEDVIIEEYTKGFDYRIIVYKNQVIDIIKRIPANITGDGEKSIEELIHEKNKVRRKVNLQRIPMDDELKRVIATQQLTLSSTLPKNKVIILRKNCNMNTGGDTSRIDISSVHTDNIKLFQDSVELLGLQLAGVDFITPDLSRSYKEIPSIINEINRAPQLGANYYADMKMDNFVAETILKQYFNEE